MFSKIAGREEHVRTALNYVKFDRMIPLYHFKIEKGTEALLEIPGEEVLSGPLDIGRRNYCA